MKIAIVHDWLVSYRGGERVLLALSNLFPDAPIYTLLHSKTHVPDTLSKKVQRTSFIHHLPFSNRLYRHFLPIYPLASETLIDKKYDLILSVSSAVSKSIDTKGAKHWCYINTPMRYIWDRFDDYFGKERVGFLASNLFFKPLAWYLKKYDVRTSNRVTTFVANSNFVKQRVFRYYNRDAEVIYPPVDIQNLSLSTNQNKGYYLFLGGLVPYKKADQAILAFNRLKQHLVVAGVGGELKFLKSISDNRYISFVGQITEDKKQEIFNGAKALIFPGVEDFGIVPVEANATGLPIIGLNQGGLVETQTDETCMFYEKQTVECLIEAVLKFQSKKYDHNKIREHSKQFSPEIFNTKIMQSIKKLL